MSKKKVLVFDENQITSSKANDDVFNLNNFNSNFQIQVKNLSTDNIEFDMIGVDASIANALRRIIIAQIPTMAFHKVLLYQNTSVLPDQLLVHRLGLLPIRVEPNMFKTRREDQDLNFENSLKFQLRVKCVRKKEFIGLKDQELENLKPQDYLNNSVVYSNQLKWIPQENQQEKLKNGVKLVHENIVIAKLRQNQEISLDIYAEKGIGRKHTKWSPVSTAFYRLMPQIRINNAFNHQTHTQTLIGACPANVFINHKGKAVVKEARNCTTCRQCIKIPGVELQKVMDHFICRCNTIQLQYSQLVYFLQRKYFQNPLRSFRKKPRHIALDKRYYFIRIFHQHNSSITNKNKLIKYKFQFTILSKKQIKIIMAYIIYL